MTDQKQILCIDPEAEKLRISSMLKRRNVDARMQVASTLDAITKELADPWRWDLILCESGLFFDTGLDELWLDEPPSPLLASLILIKSRDSQLSPAEGYRWGAMDVVQRGDKDHLLMVCERELVNAEMRKQLHSMTQHTRAHHSEAGHSAAGQRTQPLTPGATTKQSTYIFNDSESARGTQEPDEAAPVEMSVETEFLQPAADPPSQLTLGEGEDGQGTASASPDHERIKSLIDAGGLILEFQPIVSLKASSEARSLFEVLVRLKDESGQFMLPGAFLPGVVDAGWMPKIDLWIYRRVLSILTQLRENSRSRQDTVFFVNLASETLRSPQLMKSFCGFTTAARINPGSIVVEIHKDALLEVPETVSELSRVLRKHQHGLLLEDPALDDCDLLKNHKQHLSHIKLCRTITHGLAQGNISQETVARLVSCAHQAKLQSIALSVDTAALLPAMFTAGVDAIQGHFVSMPYQELLHPNMYKVESGEGVPFGMH